MLLLLRLHFSPAFTITLHKHTTLLLIILIIIALKPENQIPKTY